MAAESGKVARIKYVAAGAVNSTNEAATLATDGVTLSINSTAKRHWDRSSTGFPLVFVEGSTGTANTDAKTVNYVQGIITFATAHSTALAYTIDADYLAASYMAGGRGWSLNVDGSNVDVTTFATSTAAVNWRSMKRTLNAAVANIERIVSTGDTGPLFWDTLNAASSNLIVELWAQSSGRFKYEGFARVASDGRSVPVEGIVSESVGLAIDGQLYASTY